MFKRRRKTANLRVVDFAEFNRRSGEILGRVRAAAKTRPRVHRPASTPDPVHENVTHVEFG